jgi:hypothetical protein
VVPASVTRISGALSGLASIKSISIPGCRKRRWTPLKHAWPTASLSTTNSPSSC